MKWMLQKQKINLYFVILLQIQTTDLLFQMWQRCLFLVRQFVNQYAICCVVIPSEMTWMLIHFVLLFFPLSTAPPTVRIVHSGHACNVEEERYTERVYTIREGETLELTCLVTGHPRPQVRHSATDRMSISCRVSSLSVSSFLLVPPLASFLLILH